MYPNHLDYMGHVIENLIYKICGLDMAGWYLSVSIFFLSRLNPRWNERSAYLLNLLLTYSWEKVPLALALQSLKSSEHSRWPRFHHHLTLTSWSHRQSNFGSMRRLFSISPEECIYFDDYLPKIIGTTVNPKIVYKNLCTGLLCNSATIYYFQVVNNKTAQAIED